MRVEVGALESFPTDEGVRLTVGSERVAVFRIGETVYAIGDRCSHAEASLAEGDVYDTSVECPRHGSEFDLASGEPQQLPATKPVPTYEVTVDEGMVYLMLEEQ